MLCYCSQVMSIVHGIVEEMAKSIVSLTSTRHLQVYTRTPDNFLVCQVDFYRHENSPLGQVTAQQYTASWEYGKVKQTFKHHPLVLRNRSALERFISINRFHVGIFVIHEKKPLPPTVNNLWDVMCDETLSHVGHLMAEFDEATYEDFDEWKVDAEKKRDVLIDTVWDLIARS